MDLLKGKLSLKRMRICNAFRMRSVKYWKSRDGERGQKMLSSLSALRIMERIKNRAIVRMDSHS
jgi:hypothetical protein